MKQNLGLKLSQGISMTPQLQQAIKMLHMNRQELSNEIQNAVENNPFLELDEDDMSSEDDSDEMFFENMYDNPREYKSNGDLLEIEANREYKLSLKESLLEQVNLIHLTENQKIYATYIIDEINDEGYITVTNEAIASNIQQNEKIDVTENEVEEIIKLVQDLEPLGIGSRNLQEYLLIKSKFLYKDHELYPKINDVINKYLNLILKNNLKEIQNKLNLTQENLSSIIEMLASIGLRPIDQFNSALINNEYVIPDVIVKKVGNKWKAKLNEKYLPKLKLNHHYNSLSKSIKNAKDIQYVKQSYAEAKWFIKSLENRNETLLKVANNIIEKQRMFLEYGVHAMKPLSLKNVSESIGVHESTVSRVTNSKYMLTPQGLFELKYFFSSKLAMKEGGACSSTSIRALIQKLIEEENNVKPLSDQTIASILSSKGIEIARRTVTKYREAMGILTSGKRKKNFKKN